jgi:hypothetical protein
VYLGQYQLGDRLPIRVFCSDSDDLPVEPDEAPRACLRNASGVAVPDLWIPPLNRSGSPGLFQYPLHLDARFSTGYYAVEISWKVSGSPRATVVQFQIVAGGDPEGAVLSMYAFSRPHAEFLVYQTDSAKIHKGRNPSV